MRALLLVAVLACLPAASAPRRAICMTGDSLTYGYTFDATPIALRLATLMDVPVVNMGIGSDIAVNISARWTRYCASYPYAYAIWEGCTNDFGVSSALAVDCWATTQSWITAVEAAGHTAIVLTVFPRGGSGAWTDAKETQRLAYNALAAAYAISHPSMILVDPESALGDSATGASGTVTLGGNAGDVTIVIDGTSVGPVAFNSDDAGTAEDAVVALNANVTLGPLMTASSVGAVITITWDSTGLSGNVTLTSSRSAGTATASGATLTGGANAALRAAVDWGDRLHINGDGMQEVADAIAEALGQ